MPIPFLVLGAAGVFTVAGKAVNNDLKKEINDIYDEVEEIVRNANKKAESEMRLFSKELDTNEKKKDDLVEYFVIPFMEELKKIKNCELRERIDSGTVKKIIDINSGNYAIKKYNSTAGDKVVDTLKSAAILGAFGLLGSNINNFREYEKLTAEKTIAEGKLEQAKLESEEVKNQVAAMKEMRKQIGEITAVLTYMEKVLRMAFCGFVNVTKKSGYEYRNFTREERQLLMVVIDVFNAVNSIIIKPVIKEDGTFNQELINNSLLAMDIIENNEQLIESM